MKEAENLKEEKFIALYRTYVNEIYRYIFLRTGLDAARAEDITQDIFLDVLIGLGRVKPIFMCNFLGNIFVSLRSRLNISVYAAKAGLTSERAAW